jgi:hypothetical protein
MLAILHWALPQSTASITLQCTKQGTLHMISSTGTPILLFSYGTLQDKSVQLANFGRELIGHADALPGYQQTFVEITDPTVVATSGKTHHPIVQASANPSDEVAGTVFEITASELASADSYEVSSYKRVSVLLKSGVHAWVYVHA